MFSRDNIKLVLVAVFCLVVGLAGPSAAVIVKKALNSDKVDGLHAVKAGASVSKRKGKLVATNKQGFLPNNIIKQAPSAANAANAAKLGGQVPAAYRSISVPWSGMFGFNTGGTFQQIGLYMSDSQASAADFSVVLPDTYQAGSPVLVDVTYSRSTAQPCTVSLSGLATRVGPSEGVMQDLVVKLAGNAGPTGTIAVTNPSRLRLTLTPNVGQKILAGDTIAVVLSRSGNDPSDNCTPGFVVHGAQVRF